MSKVFPNIESYSVYLDGEDENDEGYCVMLHRISEGSTFEGYVHNLDDGSVEYAGEVTVPGIENPSPEDLALAALSEVAS